MAFDSAVASFINMLGNLGAETRKGMFYDPMQQEALLRRQALTEAYELEKQKLLKLLELEHETAKEERKRLIEALQSGDAPLAMQLATNLYGGMENIPGPIFEAIKNKEAERYGLQSALMGLDEMGFASTTGEPTGVFEMGLPVDVMKSAFGNLTRRPSSTTTVNIGAGEQEAQKMTAKEESKFIAEDYRRLQNSLEIARSTQLPWQALLGEIARDKKGAEKYHELERTLSGIGVQLVTNFEDFAKAVRPFAISLGLGESFRIADLVKSIKTLRGAEAVAEFLKGSTAFAEIDLLSKSMTPDSPRSFIHYMIANDAAAKLLGKMTDLYSKAIQLRRKGKIDEADRILEDIRHLANLGILNDVFLDKDQIKYFEDTGLGGRINKGYREFEEKYGVDVNSLLERVGLKRTERARAQKQTTPSPAPTPTLSPEETTHGEEDAMFPDIEGKWHKLDEGLYDAIGDIIRNNKADLTSEDFKDLAKEIRTRTGVSVEKDEDLYAAYVLPHVTVEYEGEEIPLRKAATRIDKKALKQLLISSGFSEEVTNLLINLVASY